MSSGSKIEYHHVFPKARVVATYGRELTDNLANLAFISGTCNRKISAKRPSDYLPALHPDRLAEHGVPDDPHLWALDRFEDFLAARRAQQVRTLNDLLGLPPYEGTHAHGPEGEVPDDEDVIEGGDDFGAGESWG